MAPHRFDLWFETFSRHPFDSIQMTTLPQLALQLDSVKDFTPSASVTPEHELESTFESFGKNDTLYELDTFGPDTSGTTRPRRESLVAPTEGGFALPPVDRGPNAMRFLFAAFILETFIWGYGFTFSLIFVSCDSWQEIRADLVKIGLLDNASALQFVESCGHLCGWNHLSRSQLHSAERWTAHFPALRRQVSRANFPRSFPTDFETIAGPRCFCGSLSLSISSRSSPPRSPRA